MIGLLVYVLIYIAGALVAQGLNWDMTGTYFLGALFGGTGFVLSEVINES